RTACWIGMTAGYGFVSACCHPLHCHNLTRQGKAVLRFIWAPLRGRPRRALALLAGIPGATVRFTALTASATPSQPRTPGTIQQNYRAAYDILVRPKGSRTALEDQRGLVRPNYLSGMFGGISLRQLDQVRAVSHVEVAAPIAMLGYLMVRTEQAVDL